MEIALWPWPLGHILTYIADYTDDTNIAAVNIIDSNNNNINNNNNNNQNIQQQNQNPNLFNINGDFHHFYNFYIVFIFIYRTLKYLIAM